MRIEPHCSPVRSQLRIPPRLRRRLMNHPGFARPVKSVTPPTGSGIGRRRQRRTTRPATTQVASAAMQVRELSIGGAWEFTPVTHGDPRGVFLEWFKADVLERAIGHTFALRQANHS